MLYWVSLDRPPNHYLVVHCMLYESTHLMRGYRPLSWFGGFTTLFTRKNHSLPSHRDRFGMGNLVARRKPAGRDQWVNSTSQLCAQAENSIMDGRAPLLWSFCWELFMQHCNRRPCLNECKEDQVCNLFSSHVDSIQASEKQTKDLL